MVREVLDEFREDTKNGGYIVDKLKAYWPVPAGFGASDLDCIVCYYGRTIAIETKAPGKKPTPRQELTIAQYRGAGAMVFVISGELGCHELRVALQGIKNANDRQPQA
jgi:hypothetical protein